MRYRYILLIVAGWSGIFVLVAAAVLPIISLFVIDGSVPYDDLPVVLSVFVVIALSYAGLLFIPVCALIGMTMQVFDDDTTDER